MKKNILVIAAHPDDEVLGCGGTIAKHAAQGDAVHVLILGEGVTSRRENRFPQADKRQLHQLRLAARKASACLKAKDLFLYDFPDNRFDSVDLLEIVKAIEKVKDKVRPAIVFTHYEKDVNIDHRRVFEATLVAFRPLPGQVTERIYSYEVPSSTDFVPFSSHFAPNVFVDISKHLSRKLKALGCYKSELRPYPHPRSPKAVALNNQLWGIRTGLKTAEAFLLIRERIL